MPPPRRWTPEESDRLRELHAAGRTLGQCATEMGRDKGTISKRAKTLGLTWDRAQVHAATVAKVRDAAARRADLELRLLDDAERLRQQLWQPAIVFNFGGRDNTYEERTLDKPPVADQLKIMQAVGVAIDRALRIADHDTNAGADDAKNLLTSLGRALGVNDATTG